ncbi:hypothetical protein HanRHA438_Chr02g0097381 [Helianthus annuus]|nr:hypothetical protein HanHA89_Chr02g0080511 [Helianthus annuus]KAJ0778730.1 hypothetical protein HanLR1_Chr02g0074831 [Helianthus annuus]KAJ0941709.1 hypothetical protein HanRHA438_Chr02g0097381 [Helianthus annuus]
MFSDFECSTSYNHKATWVKHQVVKPGRMRAQKERVKVRRNTHILGRVSVGGR